MVLSVCIIVLGDECVELGFVGLVYKVGVKFVLVSFWYVSDIGILILMIEFY